MKRRYWFGTCLLVEISASMLGFAEHALGGEPLPDASVVAYWARRPPNRAAQSKTSEVTLIGIINRVQPDGLTVTPSKKGKNQKQWLVVAESDSTDFTVRGVATLDYIREGQTVEFSGKIVKNETGAAKAKEEKLADKVAELTILSRRPGAPPSHTGNPGAGRIVAPKPETDSATTLAVPDDTDSKAADGGTPAATSADSGPKTKISGKIEKCNGKSLTVMFGLRTVHVDLADAPTINVELCDPKMVEDSKDSSKNRIEGKGSIGRLVTMMASDLVGAKIVARGTAAENKSKRKCTAKNIEITLAKPLASKKSAPPETKKTPVEKQQLQ